MSPTDGGQTEERAVRTPACPRPTLHPPACLPASRSAAFLTRCASMLMNYQQVGDPIGFAGSHQRPHLMSASVHALGAREHQLQFLCEVWTTASCQDPEGSSHLSLVMSVHCPPRAVGTFANILRRELGSREVVIMILGSSTPAHRYSSSTWLVTPVGSTRNKNTTPSWGVKLQGARPTLPRRQHPAGAPVTEDVGAL